MDNTRIGVLARELGIQSKLAVFIANDLGIDAKSHVSSVSQIDAERIRASVRDTEYLTNAKKAMEEHKMFVKEKPRGDVEEYKLQEDTKKSEEDKIDRPKQFEPEGVGDSLNWYEDDSRETKTSRYKKKTSQYEDDYYAPGICFSRCDRCTEKCSKRTEEYDYYEDHWWEL